LPSKLFEALACGRPVIAAVEGESELLVKRSGGGICVPPEDVRAIADAVRFLSTNAHICRQMGVRGKTFILQHYDRQVVAHRFERYVSATLAPRVTLWTEPLATQEEESLRTDV
jgi:glycosyltransferase involved in cell wall biosynthesis